MNRTAATRVEVGRRPLSVYDELTGTRPLHHPSEHEGNVFTDRFKMRF